MQLNAALLSYVEPSCHKHFVVFRHQQTPPLTSDECRQLGYGPSQLSVLHLAFTARDGAIGSESRFLHTPLVFDAPFRGGGCRRYGVATRRYVYSFRHNPRT